MAGSLHNFAAHGFGLAELAWAMDVMYEKLNEIVSDRDLFLEPGFMSAIFSDVAKKLPPLQEYLDYMFHGKKPVEDDSYKVEYLGELRDELFYPNDTNNQNSNELTKTYGVIACRRWIDEFTDKNKATHLYLSSQNGPKSYLKIPEHQRIELIQKYATSDPAEQPFGLGSHQLKQFSSIAYGNASGVAQAKQNKVMDRDEYSEDSFDGSFHKLQYHEKASLIVLGLRLREPERLYERNSLQMQMDYKKSEQLEKNQKKITSATSDYADQLWYLEMYHSPRRWKNKNDVDYYFDKLTDGKKLSEVKEQIKMRTIGCLWTDLKHQWTKSGLAYTSEELCGHLVQEILAYEDTHDPPTSPTMKHTLSTSAAVKLGTETVGAKNYQVDNNMRQQQMIADAKAKNRNKLDIDKAFQPSWAPPIDERMAGLRIIYNFKLKGNDNKNHKDIRKGKVIDYDIASEGLVTVRWDDNTIDDVVLREKLFQKPYFDGWLIEHVIKYF